MQQSLTQISEYYELLLAVGCLSWRTSNGDSVYRHLLTAKAAISFDASRGTISVTAPVEGTRFALEQDMLEQTKDPNRHSVNWLRGLNLN